MFGPPQEVELFRMKIIQRAHVLRQFVQRAHDEAGAGSRRDAVDRRSADERNVQEEASSLHDSSEAQRVARGGFQNSMAHMAR